MNYNDYDEVINGNDTYTEIAKNLIDVDGGPVLRRDPSMRKSVRMYSL